MPVEIRELVIRVTASEKPEPEAVIATELPEETLDALIEACVEEVLKLLAAKEER